MKIINLYIIKHVLLAILFVLLVLIGLQFFILFVQEIGRIGHGNYDLSKAFQVVILRLPKEVCLMFPIIALIGVLIGLGQMASARELVVTRAAGVSVLQVALIITQVAFGLMFLMFIVSEKFVPSLNQLADNIKLSAVSSGQTIKTNRGLWMRDGSAFVYIDQIIQDKHQLRNVVVLSFNSARQLKLIMTMDLVNWKDEQWYAREVIQQHFKQDKVMKLVFHDWVWPTHLSDNILTMSSLAPEDMPLEQLWTLIKINHKLHQSVTKLEVKLYQRVIQPIDTLVMMLLGIPFIFGPLRSSTMGAKLLLGIAVGFSFYVLNHFFASMSQVYQLPALYAVLTPTLVFGAWSLYSLRRTW